MKSTDKPSLIETVIASGAKASYVRTIPKTQTKSGSGEMSLDLGWPPECAIPVAAGGKYPQMADANGVLNLLSAAVQQLQARFFGPYNADFATAIGGYPLNAIVSDTTAGKFWVSTAEDNTTAPGSDGASWQSLFNGYATQTWADSRYIRSPANPATDYRIQTMSRNKVSGGIFAAAEDGSNTQLQPAGDYATNPALQAETQRATTAENGLQSSKANLNGGNNYTGDQSIYNARVVVHNSPNLAPGDWNYSPSLIARTDSRAGLQLFAQDQVNGGASVVLTYEWNAVQQVYWWFGSDGSINNSAKGEVAFQSQLPLPAGQKIFIFTATVTDTQDIALPQAMSNVLFVTAQGGTDGKGTGMTTVNSWTNSTVNVSVASYHTGAPQRATITQTFLVIAIP